MNYYCNTCGHEKICGCNNFYCEDCSKKDREIKKLREFIASLKVVPVSYLQSNERILMVSLSDANSVDELQRRELL